MHLDSHVPDVLVPDPGAGLDLHKIEFKIINSTEYVDSHPDPVGRECSFEQGWHGGIEKKFFGCPDGLSVLEVFLFDKDAPGESPSGQLADCCASIEDRLLSRADRVREISVVTLEVETFQTLESGDEPRL